MEINPITTRRVLNRGWGLVTRALRLDPRPFFYLIMSHPLWLINRPRMQCVTWAWSAGLWCKLNEWSCQYNPNLGANSRSDSLWQPDSLWNKNKNGQLSPNEIHSLLSERGMTWIKIRSNVSCMPSNHRASLQAWKVTCRSVSSVNFIILLVSPQWQMDHAVLSHKDKLRIVFVHHLFLSALIWPMPHCVLWNFPVFKQYQVWTFVEANLYSFT